MDTVKDQVKAFIVENFLFGDAQDGAALSPDDSFLEKGIIDSTGVLELVAFLEEEFSIKFEDEDLVPTNLDSLNRIAEFVERKRRQAA